MKPQKFVRENYRISIRPWEPLDEPYAVTQDMITACFSKNLHQLQKYIYLGWKKIKRDGENKRIVFCIATGELRQESKQHFKAGGELCWEVNPKTE
mgnify:CR=1 FL=1